MSEGIFPESLHYKESLFQSGGEQPGLFLLSSKHSDIKHLKKKSLKYEQNGLAKPGVSVCSEITFPFGDREPGQQTWEKKVSSDLPVMNVVVNG